MNAVLNRVCDPICGLTSPQRWRDTDDVQPVSLHLCPERVAHMDGANLVSQLRQADTEHIQVRNLLPRGHVHKLYNLLHDPTQGLSRLAICLKIRDRLEGRVVLDTLGTRGGARLLSKSAERLAWQARHRYVGDECARLALCIVYATMADTVDERCILLPEVGQLVIFHCKLPSQRLLLGAAENVHIDIHCLFWIVRHTDDPRQVTCDLSSGRSIY